MGIIKKAAVVSVFVLLLFLPACGGGDGPDGPGNADPGIAAGGPGGPGPEGETALPGGFAALPAADYGGAVFTVGNLSGYDWCDVTLDVGADDTGEMLNDAIYRRNREAEEKYNVVMETADIAYNDKNKIKNQMLAGYCEYDIMQMPMLYTIAPLTIENYIADANKLDKLDLSNPWWDAFAHSCTSIGGKQFFLFGDFTIADKEYAAIIFLNKELQQSYGLPDYYQVVREGKWTIGVMLESMRAVTQDLDGDGKWTKDDQYGFVVNTHSQQAVFYGAGETIIKKDGNDMPYWAIKSEAYLNAFDKMCEFLNTDNTTANAFKLNSHQDEMFANGKALFDSTLLAAVRAPVTTSMRDVEYEFGILPIPKLNENQQNYYSFMDGSTPCMAVLNNGPERLERASVIFEALNAKSSEEVQPKYMEYALPLKFFRDEESFEMLEIVLKNRIFDMAVIYGWGNFDGNDGRTRLLLRDNKPNELVSTIEKYLPQAEEEMNKDIEKIMALD